MFGIVISIMAVTIFLILLLAFLLVKTDNEWCALILIPIVALVIISFIVSNYEEPVNLSQIDIQYKSIDPSNEKYYAIGKDGIYKITPEEWWKLDVPIIAETK